MPQGQHHYVPSGIWFQPPSTHSYKILFLKSIRNNVLWACAIGLFWGAKAATAKYSFPNFTGRSMTYGTNAIASHEPASVEYIDQLKREMHAKRQKKYEEWSKSKV